MQAFAGMQAGRSLCGVRAGGCCQEMRKVLPIRSSLRQCNPLYEYILNEKMSRSCGNV